jgi:hypothetical protein
LSPRTAEEIAEVGCQIGEILMNGGEILVHGSDQVPHSFHLPIQALQPLIMGAQLCVDVVELKSAS